jgi:hypothetical protein
MKIQNIWLLFQRDRSRQYDVVDALMEPRIEVRAFEMDHVHLMVSGTFH